jgi:hypothetical protein
LKSTSFGGKQIFIQEILSFFWCYSHCPLIHDISRFHTTTHHSQLDSSGRVISLSQRPLPDNKQHSQQTDIHDLGGIRTQNLSRRAAADLRVRPRGRWNRHSRNTGPLFYLRIMVCQLLRLNRTMFGCRLGGIC